jgi:hypothetical protein
MRNDARPIGTDSHHRSPVTGRESSEDERESVTHDRQSHIVNRPADDYPTRDKVDDLDPTMPSNDSTLRTKI